MMADMLTQLLLCAVKTAGVLTNIPEIYILWLVLAVAALFYSTKE